MAPLFALSVVHTAINKINKNNELPQTKNINVDNTIKNMSNTEAAMFKTRLYMQENDTIPLILKK